MQHLRNLPESSLKTLVKKNEDYCEISSYKGELTEKCMIESATKIKIAFPSLPVQFYDLLTQRIKDKGFSDERLSDAVNHVIDNCIYPTPTIAQFLSYDKNIKIYTYDQMLKMNDEIRNPFQYYTKIDLGFEYPMYVSNRDFENNKHVLNEWELKGNSRRK